MAKHEREKEHARNLRKSQSSVPEATQNKRTSSSPANRGSARRSESSPVSPSPERAVAKFGPKSRRRDTESGSEANNLNDQEIDYHDETKIFDFEDCECSPADTHENIKARGRVRSTFFGEAVGGTWA